MYRWMRWGGAAFALGLALACSRGPRAGAGPAPVAIGANRAEVDSLWKAALGRYHRGQFDKAATVFERITLEVPATDTLAIEAHFRLAECYFAQGNQLQAAREFRKVADETPTSRLAPDALLRAGDAYADLWRRPELDPTYGQTALSTWQELLNRYPDTPSAARARARVTGIEERFASKEFNTAIYYYRLKAWDSAILYLKDLVATYPRSRVAPSALLKLVQSYRVVGYSEDIAETCGYLRRFHPGTPGVDQACPAPADTTAAPSPAS
jgi:outer membrane protein assembly factor BamD